jgi:uncharacterized repeat protein (TIGR03803 family)
LLLFAAMLTVVPVTWGAPRYKVVHAFGAGKDGAGTWGSLILDEKGNLFGMTTGGGLYGWGTAFELSPESNGKWTESILHSFNRDGQDGYESTAGLIFDTHGNLYGTTAYGGDSDYGTVFELTPGSGGWGHNVLHTFNVNDGIYPYAGLVMNGAGTLYGITPHGGTVFDLMPGSDGWTLTVIHDFTRKHGDGGGPYAGVISDQAGNLYGTTEGGGAYNAGTVYELKPTTGGGWKERILYNFCPTGFPCADGADPGVGVLAMDGSGNLYGTTQVGGPNCGCGGCDSVIYKLTRGAHGLWTESVLYNFKADSTGFSPGAGVVLDKAGNLYGTTTIGGSPQCGCGVVFKLSPSKNGKWKYTVLHTFVGSDGAQPDANLILDSKGNLYGTAVTGGTYGYGVVFEVTP